jgi:hypothetical protein
VGFSNGVKALRLDLRDETGITEFDEGEYTYASFPIYSSDGNLISDASLLATAIPTLDKLIIDPYSPMGAASLRLLGLRKWAEIEPSIPIYLQVPAFWGEPETATFPPSQMAHLVVSKQSEFMRAHC